jgi:phytoene dehydrogenase-like protein
MAPAAALSNPGFLGVKRDMANEPHWATYLLDGTGADRRPGAQTLGVKHYSFDPSLAPEGQSRHRGNAQSTYGYWQRIYGRRLYDTEQRQVCDQVIGSSGAPLSRNRSQIEVSDVATPLSYERYTGNWLGSTCGWLLTDKLMVKMIVACPRSCAL